MKSHGDSKVLSCYILVGEIIRYSFCLISIFSLMVYILYEFVRDLYRYHIYAPVQQFLFPILPLIFFCYCLFLWFHGLRNYLTKVHIERKGLRCTRFGRTIKMLPWETIVQCFVARGTPRTEFFLGNLIFISGHELTEKEKNNILQQLGKKNDIVILPYKENILSSLPEKISNQIK